MFSCGSLLIFIAHNVYKSLFNYENSIVGLYKSELELIESAHSSVMRQPAVQLESGSHTRNSYATRTDVR